MPNRLAEATSPYLLQHQHNPVDWYEWSDEAFEEAGRRNVPVFLSIGYAACHWCHVMAHESFEDPETAAMLNERFVSIKVDREERPDVDAIYMAAVQGMTGHGGWPMTVFLDHEKRPFHGGTYYPREPRGGMTTFPQLIIAISNAWRTRRDDVQHAAMQISEAIAGQASALVLESSPLDLADRLTDATEIAIDVLANEYDTKNGGFGTAPKFPPSTVLEFLIRRSARHEDARPLAMVRGTCEAMARGGIYDQLAGGFSRYSVDAHWTVPHFEKMLYDNALLLRVYTHYFRAANADMAERVVGETAEFLIRDLGTEQGGFASALDADAPFEPGGHPHEGASYAWTPEQLIEVLGESVGALAAELFLVTPDGTFEEGRSVLQLQKDPVSFAEAKGIDDPETWWLNVQESLLAARNERPQPARDDKVVAAWNGLAIAALAEAGAIFEEQGWIDAAIDAANLIERIHLRSERGEKRLVRVSKDGIAGKSEGVLEDYSDVAEGFLTLSAVTGDQHWRELAGDLLATVLRRFTKPGGGFYDTADDGEALFARLSDPADLAAPSGWSAATNALLSYGTLMVSPKYLSAAEEALVMADKLGRSAPRFGGWLLAAAEAYLDGPREVVIVGEPDDPSRRELHGTALASQAPGLVIAVGEPAIDPEDRGGMLQIEMQSPFTARPTVGGDAAAYVCVGSACYAPVTSPEELQAFLS